MVVTPYQMDIWSSNISHLYSSLEIELLKLIAKRLNSGHNDISDWQRTKLQELRLFNRDAIKLISSMTTLSEQAVKAMFEETGQQLVKSVDGQVPYETLPMPNNLDQVMRGYFNQAWGDIDNFVNQTLLSTNFGYSTASTLMYQDIINKTAAAFNSGIYTFEQALERTIQQWAQKGIKSSFIDKGGRTWSMEGYVRTVLKSTLSDTYDNVRKERMSEYGINTVVVTSHMGARAACSRIQGHVVDLRENIPPDSEYKSIYDPYWKAEYGTAGGHRGANCQHMHIPFIPGVNTNNQPKFDQEENAKVAKLMDKQRYLERQIVKFKKNGLVSDFLGNQDNKKAWDKKTRLAQSKMRELVDSNKYLSRNYAREKVYTPVNTLMKDFRYDNF